VNDATVALHEASHAVVGLELGFEVRYVTIEPEHDARGTRWGGCAIDRRPDRIYGLEAELAFALAGYATTGTEGTEHDFESCRLHYDTRKAIRHLGRAARASRYRAGLRRAREILRDQEPAVDRLAAELLRRRRLEGREVRRIVYGAKRRTS